MLRGTIESFHWGTITHPKIGEVPQKVYTPSPEDQPDLFFFAANEPLFTWSGQLEDGKFKEGVAYSVSARLQSNDYPGGNSAYFYANPFTADMIKGLPQVGDSIGDRVFITGVTVTRDNNYRVTVKFDYSPLRLPSMFGYTVTALDGDLTMAGNSRTTSESAASLEGDVYAAGDIVLKANAKVGGDAAATGNVTLSGNARVAGIVTQSVTALRFETPDMEDFLRESGVDYPDVEAMKAEAKAVPEQRITGDYTAPNGATLGTNGAYSWIDGDLTIGGSTSVTLDGVLLVGGSVTVKTTPR